MTKLYDDSGSSDSGSYGLGNLLGAGPGPCYQSFSTGSAASILGALTFDLSDSSPTDGGTVNVVLYSDSGGSAGTSITTLGAILDSSLSSASAFYTLTPSSSVTLSANTTYWVGLTDSGSLSPNAVWDYTSSATGTGTTGQSSEHHTTTSTTSQFLMTVSATALCFAAGTRILTVRGEVPVETLAEGDLAVGLHSGRLMPVRWVGHRHVDLSAHPDPDAINPVRVRANAFAPGRPNRDLILSPNHALYVDGHFIAVRYLINGATILQETRKQIDYYHVELQAHDVLLANGMTAESFLDVGNRSAFGNGDGPMMLHPDFAHKIWEAEACAPDLPKGEELAQLRQTLLDRAISLGHVLTQDADLRVSAGHSALKPVPVPGGFCYDLPTGTRRIRIESRRFVPGELRAAHADLRKLGVGITAIRLDDRAIDLDDASLDEGWHESESELRWTNGRAWLLTNGARKLTLMLHEGPVYWAEAEALATLAA